MQTVNFYFDNLTRTGNDSVTNSQRNIMNTNQANYSLYNPYNVNCDQAINFATQMPTMMVTMKGGCGADNVNQDSFLQRSAVTNDGTKLVLQPRSYLTVPYLGKGNVDCGMENDLRFGDYFREKKSVVQMMETPFMTLDNYPLMDTQVVINRGKVESGWQGGVDTRLMYRTANENANKK
jgi:hypothetical protein